MHGKNSFGIYLIFLLVIVFIGLLVWGEMPFLDPLRSALGLKKIITSGEVVAKIQSTSYLTTTKYTIKVVASSVTPGSLGGIWPNNKQMLLLAKGTVEAGIDLNQLTASDVIVSADGKNITLTLPAATIHNSDYALSNDPNDTSVLDFESGVFADTTSMQTELRSEANYKLVESACQGGILKRASSDAKLVVEELLKTLWPDVTFTVLSKPAPSVDDCNGK